MASIWFDKNVSIENLATTNNKTMAEHLGIEWVELGENFIKASMPVDDKTRQPYGLLHGGASCVLAETIGSVASAMVIDPINFYCVGMEINANHVRSVSEGKVIGVCTPLHLGFTSHVWDIRIYDEQERLLCVSRLTVAVLPQSRTKTRSAGL